MQKIMILVVGQATILSYQHNKTTIKLVKNYTMLLQQFLIKELKTKKVMSMAITMKVTITQ